MGLLSFLKRQDQSPAAAASAPPSLLAVRTRARRRLIGATLLLAIGVLGFPLLFETQPRPIAVDIPIEIPRKETSPPLVLAPPREPAAVVNAQVDAPLGPASAAATVQTPAAASPRPAPPATLRPDDGQRARALLEGKAAPVLEGKAAPALEGRAAPALEGRAAPALEGRAAPAALAASDAAGSRTVVQVGAYTEPDKLREARMKVEKLGIKTYTQVIDSDGARRTRVRVGPFATRDEAQKAAERIKAAGLPAVILSL